MFKKTIKWGILATGNIANSLAEAITASKDGEIIACASRSQESADSFGKKWKIKRCYQGYEALATDADVEIVYIATPHNFHYENMKLCLNAGKHVMCEKPLTLNAKESAEMIALARSKGLFLMEAVWMRFTPAIQKLREWVRGGLIGDVRLVTADFNFNHPFDPSHRLYNPALGGGALLDLGIYPISFTTNLLGFPDHVDARATVGSTGVDEWGAYLFDYANGAKALLTSGMRTNRPIAARVSGSLGSIEVPAMFLCPDRLIVTLDGKKPKMHKLPFRSNGYVHEVEAVNACLKAGQTECDVMPLDETQRMMELFDSMRAQWGVRYPTELQ